MTMKEESKEAEFEFGDIAEPTPEEEIEAAVQADIKKDLEIQSAVVETTEVAVPEMSLGDVMQLGAIAMASGNFPDLRNNEQAIVRIMAGRELGLQPMTALRDLYVVEGKVAMSSGLIASMIRNHPKYSYKIREMDNEHVVIDFYEEGQVVGDSQFSIEDAKVAGIYRQGSGWTKYPRNMLFARALTNGARWHCPDAFDGAVYTPEELKPLTGDTASRYEAPPSTAAPTGQPAQRATSTQTPSINAILPERTPYPAGISHDELKNEMCPVHYADPASMAEARGRPVTFFMRGAMRSHAHPTGPREAKAPWCSWQSVADDIKQEAGDVLNEAGYTDGGDKRAMVEAVFDDLIDIPLTAYRIADWKAVADYDWQETGGNNAESIEEETEQDTLF